MKLEFSAGGVIYKKDGDLVKFALILNSYDAWTFPKGHIEKGEKPEAAALREVGEEIGLKNLEIITLLEKIDYWFKLEGELIHKFVYFYLMKSSGESQFTIQEAEIKDAQWVDPKEALEMIQYKEDLPLLQKAFEILKIEKPDQ